MLINQNIGNTKKENRSKKKLKFKDYRTINAFSNLYIEGDYNPNHYTCIDKETNDYFFQFKDCYTCKLEMENVPPLCLSKCRFKTHPVNSRNLITGKFKGRACIALMRHTNLYNLFLSRTQLSFNHQLYLLGYRMIIWSGTDSGMQIDHKNKNCYDDRRSNLALLFTKGDDYSHNKCHFLRTKYRNKIIELKSDLNIIQEGSNKSKNIIFNKWKTGESTEQSILKELNDTLKEMYNLSKVTLSPFIKEYLDEAQHYIDKDIMFEPDWIKEKIKKYKNKYIWI